MNEVCFGHVYCDQREIPFVVYERGICVSLEFLKMLEDLKRCLAAIQIDYVFSCVVDSYQRSDSCVEC
jgi:hypothetical protein